MTVVSIFIGKEAQVYFPKTIPLKCPELKLKVSLFNSKHEWFHNARNGNLKYSVKLINDRL